MSPQMLSILCESRLTVTVEWAKKFFRSPDWLGEMVETYIMTIVIPKKTGWYEIRLEDC